MFNHPYFLLMLAPLIWGGHAVIGKLATGDIAPMTLTFLRWVVVLLVLLPIVFPHLKKDRAVIKRHLPVLFAYGCFGFAAFNMLNYTALHHTTALNVALVQAAIPMIILLLNFVIFRQRLFIAQVIGLLLAFIGVLLIITDGSAGKVIEMRVNRGDVLMLIACVLYAGYSIVLRYKPPMSWLSFIFVLGVSALLTATPFMIYEVLHTETPIVWSFSSLIIVLYVSVFASIVGQIAYAKGVSLIGANRAGFALNLVPLFGALMAVVFLGEAFRWFHLAGLLLIMGGIALSERTAKATSQPHKHSK